MDFLEGLTEGKGDMTGTWFKHLPTRPAATSLTEEKTGRESYYRESKRNLFALRSLEE